MKISFTPRATRDLEAIADFLNERSPAAASDVLAAIIRSIRNLLLFPRMGRRQDVAGVRKLVARPYPYLIFYTIDRIAGVIAILTIQHLARKPEYQDT